MNTPSTTTPFAVAPQPAPSSVPPKPRVRRRVALTSLAAEASAAVATIAALCGAVTLIWLALSPLFGLSLVVFMTGSMTPAVPQGALAVAREVPASDLVAGDIAMVQRPGEMPVSHRVISVEHDPRDPSIRVVSMQGDDNPVPDADPYRIAEARVILLSLPGGAAPYAAVRSPLVMGALTAAAALLVLRAFWPSGSRPPRERRGASATASGG